MSALYGQQQAMVLGEVLVVGASGEYGWSLAQWAVANAKALNINEVSFDSRTWTRGSGDLEGFRCPCHAGGHSYCTGVSRPGVACFVGRSRPPGQTH